MSIYSKIPHPILNAPGISQQERLLAQLNPDNIQIDGRTMADLLDFIFQMSKQVKYYKLNLDMGDWRAFFAKSLPFQIAQISKTNTTQLEQIWHEHEHLLEEQSLASNLQLVIDFMYHELLLPVANWQTLLQPTENGLGRSLNHLIATNLRADVAQFIYLSNAAKSKFGIQAPDFRALQRRDIWTLDFMDLFTSDLSFFDESLADSDNILALHQKLESIFQHFLEVMKEVALSAPNFLAESLSPLKEDFKENHSPHLGLMFAFLHLFQKFQADINQLTARHLDFFYQEALKIVARKAVPDQAHLVLALQKQTDQYLLKKGLLFQDGKDANDQDIFFSLDEDIVLDKANIASLKTLFLHHLDRQIDGLGISARRFVEGIYTAPVANFADGIGEEAFKNPTQESWPTLGAKNSKFVLPKQTNPQAHPEARMGFVLASPILLLQEGQRIIEIELDGDLGKNVDMRAINLTKLGEHEEKVKYCLHEEILDTINTQEAGLSDKANFYLQSILTKKQGIIGYEDELEIFFNETLNLTIEEASPEQIILIENYKENIKTLLRKKTTGNRTIYAADYQTLYELHLQGLDQFPNLETNLYNYLLAANEFCFGEGQHLDEFFLIKDDCGEPIFTDADKIHFRNLVQTESDSSIHTLDFDNLNALVDGLSCKATIWMQHFFNIPGIYNIGDERRINAILEDLDIDDVEKTSIKTSFKREDGYCFRTPQLDNLSTIARDYFAGFLAEPCLLDFSSSTQLDDFLNKKISSDEDADAIFTEADIETIKNSIIEKREIEIFSPIFQVSLSGVEDWIRPQHVSTTIFKSSNNRDLKITIKVSLSLEEAAIYFNQQEVLKEIYETPHPLIKVELNPNYSITCPTSSMSPNCSLERCVEPEKVMISPYQFFRCIHIRNSCIKVTVCGLKNIVVQNDENVQDINDLIYPFGVRPSVETTLNLSPTADAELRGSNFFIGSKEIFCKKWNKVWVNINWKDKPADFQEYYLGYRDIFTGTGLVFEKNFKVKVSILENARWKKEQYEIPIGEQNPFLDIERTETNQIIEATSKKYRQLFASSGQPLCQPTVIPYEQRVEIDRSFFQLNELTKTPDDIPLERLDVNTKDGFLRLTLTGQDFQHNRYSFILARQMMAFGKLPEYLHGAVYFTVEEPEEPHTEVFTENDFKQKIKTISLDEVFEQVERSLDFVDRAVPKLENIIFPIKAALDEQLLVDLENKIIEALEALPEAATSDISNLKTSIRTSIDTVRTIGIIFFKKQGIRTILSSNTDLRDFLDGTSILFPNFPNFIDPILNSSPEFIDWKSTIRTIVLRAVPSNEHTEEITKALNDLFNLSNTSFSFNDRNQLNLRITSAINNLQSSAAALTAINTALNNFSTRIQNYAAQGFSLDIQGVLEEQVIDVTPIKSTFLAAATAAFTDNELTFSTNIYNRIKDWLEQELDGDISNWSDIAKTEIKNIIDTFITQVFPLNVFDLLNSWKTSIREVIENRLTDNNVDDPEKTWILQQFDPNFSASANHPELRTIILGWPANVKSAIVVINDASSNDASLKANINTALDLIFNEQEEGIATTILNNWNERIKNRILNNVNIAATQNTGNPDNLFHRINQEIIADVSEQFATDFANLDFDSFNTPPLDPSLLSEIQTAVEANIQAVEPTELSSAIKTTVATAIESIFESLDAQAILIITDEIKAASCGAGTTTISDLEFPNETADNFKTEYEIYKSKLDTASPLEILNRLQEYLERKKNSNDLIKGSGVVIPKEPYTPIIKDISLDYTAKAYNCDIELFHIHPFENTYQKQNINENPTLLPSFADEGTLFIGLEQLTKGNNLNLLFQLAEATADSESDKADIQWHYLIDNDWVELRSGFEIISDNTNELTTSGIVQIALPADISNQHTTIMPPELHWIKVATRANVVAVGETIAIHTQAAKVTFKINPENDTQRLAQPLAAEQISKLAVADSSIKSVGQFYPSFGGRPTETKNNFYLRVSEQLRHKGRAVSSFDYERLVLDRFNVIFRVKCIHHSLGLSARKYRKDLELAPGFVLMAIVPDLNLLTASNALEPRVPLSLLEEVEAYLKTKISPFVRFKVMNPRYEKVHIKVEVALYKGKSEAFFKAQLEQDLQDFLSPWVRAGSDQLLFGKNISKSDLIRFIEATDYVDYISDLAMAHEEDLVTCYSTTESDSTSGDIPLLEILISKVDALLKNENNWKKIITATNELERIIKTITPSHISLSTFKEKLESQLAALKKVTAEDKEKAFINTIYESLEKILLELKITHFHQDVIDPMTARSILTSGNLCIDIFKKKCITEEEERPILETPA